jgi:hypothetical protein
VLAFWGLSSGCGISTPSTTPTPTLTARTPEAAPNLVVSPTLATTGNQRGIPTAVRVLSADPQDIVLRSADLPNGFSVRADHQTVDVNLATSTETDSQAPQSRGTGHHVALAHDGGPDPDGVLSIASTAVRYETTRDAVAWFAYEVHSAPAVRPYAILALAPALGDESRAWRYAIDRVIVDEMLVRRRNFLLSIAVVHNPGPRAPDAVLRYAHLLRSKLPD